MLLGFWTTWCGPCGKSAQSIERIYAEFKNRGLMVLAVNAGEERGAVEEFLKKTPMAYPPVGGGESAILTDYHIVAYPTFVLVGSDGKVAAYEIGFGGESMIRAMLEKTGLTSRASQR